METRKLGNLEVSAISLGCMGFSHAYGVAMDEKEAISRIRAAYDMGYRMFDTAECYTGETADGRMSYNEELVGKALADVRDDVVIATKFGVNRSEEDGKSLVLDSSPATIRKSVEGSLARLGVDYIDLYYQHRIDGTTEPEPEAVAEVMADLIKEGKILHWGISETTEDYLRRAHAVCPVTAIQNRYSMMARWHESLFPTLEELNIGFVAFSPMANGFLTDAIAPAGTYDTGDYRNDMPQYTKEGIEAGRELKALLDTLAKEHNASEGQIALAWVLAQKPYIVPIPGSRRLDRMAENAKAIDVALSAKDLADISALLDRIHIPVFGGHAQQK